jgi:hypothetical protein
MTAAQLAAYQRAVDGIGRYEEQVAEAKAAFSRYNKRTNAAFGEVRQLLTEMCSGAARCSYCEDSYADEVEHVRPKDLYPSEVFAWLNYCYACGPCNGPKHNKYSVIDSAGAIVDVTRRRGAPVTPPQSGTPALINPRLEDPLEFIQLDIVDTFLFVPITEPGSVAELRAVYTIDVLQLNGRDYLSHARRGAYEQYLALLKRYATLKDENAGRTALRRVRRAILQLSAHPTVFYEMKRQRKGVPELSSVFGRVPEAVRWRLT